ncbi:MAG: hypothetical protein M0Q54_00535 [Pigmentiphaga sp.]|nr:hypothetical protein [Pigmentiphaga sp.]
MKKIILFLFLFAAILAQAKVIYVKPAVGGGDDDSGNGASWEYAFATPNKAYQEALEGDTIAIMQGTYLINAALNNSNKPTNVTIEGGYNGIDYERAVDPTNTIFEYAGGDAVRILEDHGSITKFSGITFQNLTPAESQYGIFAQILANDVLTLEDCIVKNFVNKAGLYIRGILRFNATATLNIDRCQFIDCEEKSTAANNAVITRNAGNATLNITNSIIKGTKTRPFLSGAAGGSNKRSIINCTFIDNSGGMATTIANNWTNTISNNIIYNSTITGADNLNYSYYNSNIGNMTPVESVQFTDASKVFADLVNFYPAADFAGLDAGDNSVVVGDKDIAGNTRVANTTVDIGAYENIPAPTLSKGANVTDIGELEEDYYPYGIVLEVPVTVSTGAVPDPIEGVLFTGTEPEYTANITVTKPMTIEFTASQAQYEVTVNTTNVTITAPTLIDGKYNSASTSVIYFTIDNETENPIVTVDEEPVSTDYISGNDYSVTLTDISGDITVDISASVKKYAVTVTTNDLIASVLGLNVGENNIEYGTTVSNLKFTLEEGAHSPYILLNGSLVTATEDSGEFTIPSFDVEGAVTISITAFPENVLFVSEDTYQRRSGEVSGYYANENTLASRGEPGGWAIIPLLKFVPTEEIKEAGYNKAELRLVQTAGFSVNYTIRQIPEVFDDINNVGVNSYTTLQNAAVVGKANQAVNGSANQATLFDVTDAYVLDFPEEIRLSVVKATNGTVHYFHSLENGNPDYVPQLVFSTEYQIDVAVDGYVTITSPEGDSPYAVKAGDGFELVFTLSQQLKDLTIGGVDWTEVYGADLTEESGVYTLALDEITEDTNISISTTITSIENAQTFVNLNIDKQMLTIHTEQTESVQIYSVSGQLLKDFTITGSQSIALKHGVYLVKIADVIHKITL